MITTVMANFVDSATNTNQVAAQIKSHMWAMFPSSTQYTPDQHATTGRKAAQSRREGPRSSTVYHSNVYIYI